MHEFRVGREAKFPFMGDKTLLQWIEYEKRVYVLRGIA